VYTRRRALPKAPRFLGRVRVIGRRCSPKTAVPERELAGARAPRSGSPCPARRSRLGARAGSLACTCVHSPAARRWATMKPALQFSTQA